MNSADSFTNLQSQLSNSNNTLTITFDGATSLSCSSCPSGVTVSGTNTVIVDFSFFTSFAGLAANGTNSNTITLGGGGIDLSNANGDTNQSVELVATTVNVAAPIVTKGLGAVSINADTINGSGLITTPSITMLALSGIGDTMALNLAAASIAADSTEGKIDLANALGSAVTVSSLTTKYVGDPSTDPGPGGSLITFNQSGGGTVTFNNVSSAGSEPSSGWGVITLTNAGGGIIVAGNGVSSAYTTSTISLTTTGSGNIAVNAAVDALLNDGNVNLNSAGSILGSGLITGSQASLVANTGINANANFSQGFSAITSAAGDIIVANQWQFDVPTINSAGNVSISSAQGLSFSNPISANGTVTLTALGGDLQGGSLISSTSVTMVAQSGITQSGAMTVPGTSLFNAGDGVINFTNAGNDFTGAVSLTNTGAHNVAITDVDEITLGVTSLGTGTLEVTGTIINLNNNVSTTNNSQTYTGNVVVNANNGGNPVTLSAGSGAITIPGNIDSATGHNYSLTLTSTGDVTIGGAIGNTQALGILLITGNDISLGNIGGASAGTTSNVSVQASDLNSDTASITLTGTTYNTTGQQFYNSSAYDGTRPITLLGSSAGSTINLTTAGAYSNNAAEFTGLLSLNGRNLSIDTTNNNVTTGGDITFNQTVNGAGALALNAGSTGNIIASGTIGATTTLTGLTITNAASGSFVGSIHANTIAINDTTNAGLVNFVGNLAVDTGMTIAANGAYNVQMIGASNTIAGVTTFGNSGSITFGDAGTDNFNFVGGIIATTPSAIFLAGSVTAAGTGVITLGDSDTSVTILGSTLVGGTSTGNITLGNATLISGTGLMVGTGIANAINLAAVTGTAGGIAAESLTFNTTGAVTVAGAVGTDIGSLTITNSGGTTFQSTVNAATTTITATTGTVAFQGNLTLGTSLVTAAQGYNVSITGTSSNIAGATTLLNTGTVTLGNGTNDSTTFAGGLVITAPSSIAIQGTVATTNATMTLGDAGTGVILGANTILNAGAGNINLDGIVSGLFSLTPINTSPGLTTISGANSNTTTHVTTGVVQINNSTQTTNFVVSGGTLKGTGAIGTLTATGTGVIAPGNSPGKVTTTNLSLNSTNTLQIEITGSNLSPVAGTDYDQIVVSSGGSVNLGGATLNLFSSLTGNAGSVFTIIDNQGSSIISTTFNSLAEGAVITANGRAYQISYVGGTGNDVTLTAVLPVITAINPTFGPTSGGSPITITGSNLTGATGITIDSATCSSFVVVSATSATCTTPAGSAGTASVIVTTPSGINSANTLFTYVGAPTATTGSASSITTNGAILGGLVSSNGASTTVNFNYGLTTSYGSSVIAAESPLSLSANSASVSALLSWLECNKTYHFQVTANNGTITNGNDATFVTSNCDSTSVPSSLMIVSASPLDAKAVVNWTAPDNGGSVITGYTVTSSPDSKTCATTGNPAPTSCVVSSLTHGTPYTFTVTATNSIGTSAASLPSNTVTPTNKKMMPAIPGLPNASPGDKQVTVSWAQVLTGGDPLSYSVTATPGGKTCTRSFPGLAFPSASCTVTGLTNGTAYTFKVLASNSMGSAPSKNSASVTPEAIVNGSCGTANGIASIVNPSGNLCKSGTPTLVESGQGSFTWSCAGANGGSTAQCRAPGQLDRNQDARTTFTTPTANGCRIQRAQLLPVPNGGPSGGVTLPYQVLDFEMVGCQATQAIVTMTYSRVVKGIDFWKYIRGNWIKLTKANSELTLVGNTATFAIQDNGPLDADLAVGQISDPAGPGYSLLPALPRTPVNPKATAGDSEATVRWTAPSGGAAPVTYTVTSTPDSKTCTALAPKTTCKVSGLTNNTYYTFGVAANNATGSGPVSSNSNSVTPSYSGQAGNCGTATTQASLTPPKNHLCSIGPAGTVVAANGGFTWQCSAVGHNIAASCTAKGATSAGTIASTTLNLLPNSGCSIKTAQIGNPATATPTGVTLSNGVVNFTLTGCSQSAHLNLTSSSAVNGLAQWEWIHQVWVTIPGAVLSGHTATFTIADNGPYDTDSTVGTISVSSGPGNSNGKFSQQTLLLASNVNSIKSGRAVLLKVTGGSGEGQVNYSTQSSGDVSCSVRAVGNQSILKTSGQKNGTCSAWATKAATATYNAAVSNPVTVNVTGAR